MSDPNLVVRTRAGTVRGERAGQTVRFRGIPYGAPTGGSARFLPPRAAEPWDDVLDAFSSGASCPQPQLSFNLPPALLGPGTSMSIGGDGDVPQGEDCLVLNLWTPAADDGARPVMVWLHGGGYAIGAGTSSTYDGERMAARGDAVIVAVNHRIGPLGYLHLGDLGGARFRGSGNAGNLDLVLLLEWVRDNIAGFGGDPDNVTIYGESGGGRKATKLLTMPSARGLFHRAIIQSGAQPYTYTADEGTAIAERLLDRLELTADQLDTLQSLPAADIIGSGFRILANMPVVDGDVLPMQPLDAILAGNAVDVPVMIGTTRDEAALQLLVNPATKDLDDDGIRDMLRTQVGEELAASVLPVYEKSRPGATGRELMVACLTDRDRRLPAIRVAEALVSTNASNVYMYVFAYAGKDSGGWAIHGSELQYMFDRVATERPDDSEAQHVADQMCDAWPAFARSGDPNHDGMALWNHYDTDRRATLFFEAEAKTIDDPWAAEREAWDGVLITGMSAG